MDRWLLTIAMQRELQQAEHNHTCNELCSSASFSVSEALVVFEREVWKEGCAQVPIFSVHSLQVHE